VDHRKLQLNTQHTGWRRCIGCLKLRVAFRKRANNYRALLRKMTHKDQASYGSSLLCSPTNHRKATTLNNQHTLFHTPHSPTLPSDATTKHTLFHTPHSPTNHRKATTPNNYTADLCVVLRPQYCAPNRLWSLLQKIVSLIGLFCKRDL